MVLLSAFVASSPSKRPIAISASVLMNACGSWAFRLWILRMQRAPRDWTQRDVHPIALRAEPVSLGKRTPPVCGAYGWRNHKTGRSPI